MANLLNNFKEKIANSFGVEEAYNPGAKQNIQARANKGIMVGGGKQEASNAATQNRILDTSDDVYIVRCIKLLEDGGNQMVSIIERIERGQLVVADFSESSPEEKTNQFHVLWGAVIAHHGSYRVLDKGGLGNLILFTNGENKIAEEGKK